MPAAVDESDDGAPSISHTIYGRAAEGWVIRAGRGADAESGVSPEPLPRAMPAPRLESGTAEILMLFQDLLNLKTDRSTFPYFLMWRNINVRRWAESEWRTEDAKQVKITWPTPPWSSFWEYDLFFALWNKTLNHLGSTGTEAEGVRLAQLVFYWVDAGTAVLSWQQPFGVPGSNGLEWQKLVNRLETLIAENKETGFRAETVRWWLIHVACLLMREMIGDRSDITSSFASSTVLKDFWRKSAREIRYTRRWTISQFEQNEMQALAELCRSSVPPRFPAALKAAPGKHKSRSRGSSATAKAKK